MDVSGGGGGDNSSAAAALVAAVANKGLTLPSANVHWIQSGAHRIHTHDIKALAYNPM